MRVAWFSPLPPTRSGIAAYSADLLPHLERSFEIERFDEPAAHDFVWKQRLRPYDLVVYQLGNAPCHDYQWAYLVRYPGLVVLHDARLHHARARSLLQQGRFDDYRVEFRYDHPDARAAFAEYAIEGLGGSIYYFWSMLRVVMRSARMVAVHNDWVARELREDYPGVDVATIRMGVPRAEAASDARDHVRRTLGIPRDAFVFAAFGKITPEKRIRPILQAAATLAADGLNVHVLLVGDAVEHPTLERDIARDGIDNRVRVAGFVPDEAVGDYLAAADACLCLRWPTAQETSASWLRCLSAARPTVVTELAHLADVPTLDPRTWRATSAAAPVAVGIDLLDENRSLELAMRRLVTDAVVRQELSRAGHAYWTAHHGLASMASDYRRVMMEAAARPAPVVTDLPAHFTNTYAEPARALARQCGVDVDILTSG